MGIQKKEMIMINPEHYVSLKVAEELEKANIKFNNSLFVFRYSEFHGGKYIFELRSIHIHEGLRLLKPVIAAPLLVDIMDRLPSPCNLSKHSNGKDITYCCKCPSHSIHVECDDNATDTAALLLIKLKEANGM